MLRMSKLTDYSTLVLAHLAGAGERLLTAADVAEQTGLAAPTVSKLLKALTRAGLVNSVRGPHGGYALARPAAEISAADVIDALEGPVAITTCSIHDGNCELEPTCSVGTAWQRINLAIRRALRDVSLEQLAGDADLPAPRFDLGSAVTKPGTETPMRFIGRPARS